jgi:hypothetical protein
MCNSDNHKDFCYLYDPKYTDMKAVDVGKSYRLGGVIPLPLGMGI